MFSYSTILTHKEKRICYPLVPLMEAWEVQKNEIDKHLYVVQELKETQIWDKNSVNQILNNLIIDEQELSIKYKKFTSTRNKVVKNPISENIRQFIELVEIEITSIRKKITFLIDAIVTIQIQFAYKLFNQVSKEHVQTSLQLLWKNQCAELAYESILKAEALVLEREQFLEKNRKRFYIDSEIQKGLKLKPLVSTLLYDLRFEFLTFARNSTDINESFSLYQMTITIANKFNDKKLLSLALSEQGALIVVQYKNADLKRLSEVDLQTCIDKLNIASTWFEEAVEILKSFEEDDQEHLRPNYLFLKNQLFCLALLYQALAFFPNNKYQCMLKANELLKLGKSLVVSNNDYTYTKLLENISKDLLSIEDKNHDEETNIFLMGLNQHSANFPKPAALIQNAWLQKLDLHSDGLINNGFFKLKIKTDKQLNYEKIFSPIKKTR